MDLLWWSLSQEMTGRTLATLCLLVAGCATGQDASIPPEESVPLTECRFEVPAPYKHGYADFSVIVRFEVDESGAPRNVEVLKNLAGIAESAIEKCVSSWRLPDAPSEAKLATFNWAHNEGWTTLRISGSGSLAEYSLSD